MSTRIRIRSVWIQAEDRVEVLLTPHETPIPCSKFVIPGLTIHHVRQKGDRYEIATSPIDIKNDYRLVIDSIGEAPLIADHILNRYVSNKPLGCVFEGNETVFRLFAPQAKRVQIALWPFWDDLEGTIYDLTENHDGVWELRLKENLEGWYYAYRLNGRHPIETTVFSELDIPDPYSRCVIRLNHYTHPSKTRIVKPNDFSWEGDTWRRIPYEDLIIYELHVRDFTIHPSSRVSPQFRGTYTGLAMKGVEYLRSLGVNAVELMPVFEFANLEVPYRDWRLPVYNTWNPYARNHWGYMPSFFFVPDSYYAAGGHLTPGEPDGGRPEILDEFKEMVKAFHRAGIAVILDVVYNHVSQYDLNPLKQIDRAYYFRLDADGRYQNKSFCGNDLYTERPMVRRLILDSLIYWMTEFHIDGFRFDLAGLMDDETLDAITETTRAIHPGVILIAEPWGGDRYGQERYSQRGWASWNDHFRNGVKGGHPIRSKGFLFGERTSDQLTLLIRGSTQKDGGPYVSASHSVNYLECHDEWTLGDFIRIASGEVSIETVVQDLESHVRLSEKQEKYHRLAALILFTSRGMIMLHAGQEFARSKVIAKRDVDDPDIGKMDPNSYNKDNETNWIQYTHTDWNRSLLDYYRGCIRLRRDYPCFRETCPQGIRFFQGNHPLTIGYEIRSIQDKTSTPFLILINAHPTERASFLIPEGEWSFFNIETQTLDPQVWYRGEKIEVFPLEGKLLIGLERSYPRGDSNARPAD